MRVKQVGLAPITCLKVSIDYMLDCAVAAGVITADQAQPIRDEVWALPLAEPQEASHAAS